MPHPRPLLAGIEAGGTKIVCAVAETPDRIVETETFQTGLPGPTLSAVADWLAARRLEALGVVTFGPADLAPTSPTYGFITTTPKPGWRNTDLIGPLRARFPVPIAFDTDVNGAAIGEACFGAGRGADPLVYVTVGTGIGGGALVNGSPVHGLVHPEMGHMAVKRHPNDTFQGACPFHRDCLEGLASGTAIRARSGGTGGERLPANSPEWRFVAHYLGQAAGNIVLMVSPRRLIFGGGVMRQPGLIESVRAGLTSMLAGYVDRPELGPGVDRFLLLPGLGDLAGVTGALELARRARDHSR